MLLQQICNNLYLAPSLLQLEGQVTHGVILNFKQEDSEHLETALVTQVMKL